MYRNRIFILISFIYITLSCVVRGPALFEWPFWIDELRYTSLGYIEENIFDIFIHSFYSFTAPIYLVLLKYWNDIFGYGEFVTRLPSFLFSTLAELGALFVLFKLTKKDILITSAAALSLIFCSWAFRFSVDASPYALSVFFIVSTLWMSLKVVERGKLSTYSILSLMSLATLSALTHYIAGLISVTLCLSSFWILRSKINRYQLLELILTNLFGLFSFLVMTDFKVIRRMYRPWIESEITLSLIYRELSGMTTIAPLPVIILVVLSYNIFSKEEKNNGNTMIVLSLLSSLTFLFVYSFLNNLFLDRYLALLTPLVLVVFFYAVSRARNKYVKFSILSLSVFFSVNFGARTIEPFHETRFQFVEAEKLMKEMTSENENYHEKFTFIPSVYTEHLITEYSRRYEIIDQLPTVILTPGRLSQDDIITFLGRVKTPYALLYYIIESDYDNIKPHISQHFSVEKKFEKTSKFGRRTGLILLKRKSNEVSYH